jgi:hypothetical protein
MEELIFTALGLLLPPIIPTLTAWSHPNWKGVILGALTLWVFVILAEVFLLGRYGTGGPGGIGLVLWVIGGLPVSVIYCWTVLKIRRATKKVVVEPIPPVVGAP